MGLSLSYNNTLGSGEEKKKGAKGSKEVKRVTDKTALDYFLAGGLFP
jgi:hypothetical protein